MMERGGMRCKEFVGFTQMAAFERSLRPKGTRKGMLQVYEEKHECKQSGDL